MASADRRTGEYFLFTKRQFRLVDEARHANDSRMNPFAVFAPFAIVGGFLTGVTIAPLVDVLCLPYDAGKRRDGTVIRVVDEDGRPAAGIRVVLGCFDFERVEGVTDKCGEIRNHGDLRVWRKISRYELTGDGYYPAEWYTNRYPYEPGVGDFDPAIDAANVLTLRTKKVVKPVPMAYGRMEKPQKRKKESTPYLDFDCELGDWLPPDGVGRNADLRVESFPASKEAQQADVYTNVLAITALGPGAGFARRPNDLPVRLGSDLRVPEGLEFATNRIEELFVFHREGNRYDPGLSKLFEWRNYYVMRLRGEVDEAGALVRARYGKMVFMTGSGCLAQTYLNEMANERSLECRLGENPAYEKWRKLPDRSRWERVPRVILRP